MVESAQVGLVFGPKGRWLTFVPYSNLPAYQRAEPDAFAADLSRVTGCPVLHYRYGEDHGWTFALARPRTALSRFACWWDPAPTVERNELDLDSLATFAPLTAIEPLLQSVDRQSASEEEPAYRFAELLGFPAYKWLSPDLAQRHTEDFLKEGGRKLGTKPQDISQRLQLPPPRQIALPRDDLSAREALFLIKPFAARFEHPWYLASIGSYGHIRGDGRGDWRPTYRCGTDVVHLALIAKGLVGRLSFQGQSMPASVVGGLDGAVPLPDEWLDSTDVAAIVARQDVPEGLGEVSLGLMSLTCRKGVLLHWTVYYCATDRGKEFTSWTLEVAAATGEILLESLGRLVGYAVVPARRRVQCGDWIDLTAPAWVAAVEEERGKR
jgi:hypothetical protein